MSTRRAVRSFLWGMLWLAGGAGIEAGTISLAWDAIPDVKGYRVYYGRESGNYSHAVEVGKATSVVLQGLDDCTTWYVAVKAYTKKAESIAFSNEIRGWPRPEIRGTLPAAVLQGERLTLEVSGANFQPDAAVVIDHPHVHVESATAVSCDRLRVSAAVEPTTPGFRAARIGRFDLEVLNPDGAFGVGAGAFEIRIDQARFDLDRRNGPSRGRLDGHDTIWLSRLFGSRDGEPGHDPDADFDGDGWVDGTDLAYLASLLGTCWDGAAWSLSACKEP